MSKGPPLREPGPPLREPDLPRTAKLRPHALRTGFSTGACSAAAAKAAVPSGDRHSFIVHSLRCEGGTATAVVVKDAGDDPDVTHGAHLTVTVGWRSDGEVVLHGGAGVGVVTQAGLGLPVGQPAINPVPRQMITDAVWVALRRAVQHGLTEVVFVGMIGKLTKLASGVLMTHYTRSRVDTGLLAEITAAHGGGPEDVAEIRGAPTARRAYEIWEAGGLGFVSVAVEPLDRFGAPLRETSASQVQRNARATGDLMEARHHQTW